ncbi:MAG: hypothetical protein ACREA8_01050 [Nitrosotalea sp.]
MTRNGEKFYHTVLNALFDQDIMSIIHCTSKNAKTMNDVIKETGLSRTTAHRKLTSMMKDELLGIENYTITEDGKKSKLFRSRLDSIKVKYEGNNMFVIIEENPNIISKLLMLSYTKNDGDECIDISETGFDPNYLIVK